MSTDQLRLTEIESNSADQNDPDKVFIVYGSTRWEIIDRLEKMLEKVGSNEYDTDKSALAESLVNDHSTLSSIPEGYVIYNIDRTEIFSDLSEIISSIDDVYIFNFHHIGSKPGIIANRVEMLFSHGLTLYLVDSLLKIPAEDDEAEVLVKILRELDHAGVEIGREIAVRDIRRWMDDISHDGRPPFGFRVEDGELRPVENFDEIRATLTLVLSGELSKRKAADRLGCSPRTITRALERPEMYGLD